MPESENLETIKAPPSRWSKKLDNPQCVYSFITPIKLLDRTKNWMDFRALVSFTCKENVVHEELRHILHLIKPEDDDPGYDEPIFHFGQGNDRLDLTHHLHSDVRKARCVIRIRAGGTGANTGPVAANAYFASHSQLYESVYARSMRDTHNHRDLGWDMVIGVETLLKIRPSLYLPDSVIVASTPFKENTPHVKPHSWGQDEPEWFNSWNGEQYHVTKDNRQDGNGTFVCLTIESRTLLGTYTKNSP